MATNIARRPGSARLTVTDTTFPTAAQVTFDEVFEKVTVLNESGAEWIEISFDGGTTLAARLTPGVASAAEWTRVKSRGVTLRSQSGAAPVQVCVE